MKGNTLKKQRIPRIDEGMGESLQEPGRAVWLRMAILVAVFWAPLSRAEAPAPVGDVKPKHCTLPEGVHEKRPDPAGTPTRITVGIRLADLLKIDDVNQTMTVEYFIVQRWTDRRLTPFAGCRFTLDQIWTPDLELASSGRVFASRPEEVRIEPGGIVEYLQRYRGTVSTRHYLYDFPFDTHELRLSVVSVEYGQDEVALVSDKRVTGRGDIMTIPDWSIGRVSAVITPWTPRLTQQVHARYDLVIRATRRAGYYLTKVIFPLVLIVAMSWAVFWISPTDFGPQLGMSATAMLTLIAFQFALGNILPRASYVTRMDQFILGSTTLVFMALIESLTTHFLVVRNKTETALQVDRICRWVFPLAFAVIALFIFLA